MSNELDDEDLALEGVQAFNRMTAAMDRLDGRLSILDTGLGTKVSSAERAAVTAEAAAARTEVAAIAARETALARAHSATAWAACAVLAGVLAAGGIGYLLGERAGGTVGQANGYRAAVDEKAAASWANTPSGRLAFALDQAGSLNLVATCSGQGWKVEKQHGSRVCFPKVDRDDSLYGWTLP